MRVETALSVFIDEVNNEYYDSYSVQGNEEVIILGDSDLVELPFLPHELNQYSIRVW